MYQDYDKLWSKEDDESWDRQLYEALGKRPALIEALSACLALVVIVKEKAINLINKDD